MIRHNLWASKEKEPRKEISADFVVSDFRQLPSLIFNHGYNSYIQTSKLIVYYMYKNMILVFCEMWFATACGFSGQRYWNSTLITLYNGVLTTFQCFVALNFETANADPNFPMVSPVVYRRGISSHYTNAMTFLMWTFTSFLHGTLIYYLVSVTFSTPVNEEGHMIDFQSSANISYCAIVHLVNVKLFLELNVRNKLAI